MTFACVGLMLGAMAQDEEAEQKESNLKRLFTGGSISLAFGSNSFLVGGSPVFGYSLADWVDAGIVVNGDFVSASTTIGGSELEKTTPGVNSKRLLSLS